MKKTSEDLVGARDRFIYEIPQVVYCICQDIYIILLLQYY